MQSRIPKILISLALAVPVSLGATAAVRTVSFSDALEAVRFYSDFPDASPKPSPASKRFRSG